MPADVILVSMDVTGLYTNIPQKEGIKTENEVYLGFRNLGKKVLEKFGGSTRPPALASLSQRITDTDKYIAACSENFLSVGKI